MADQRQMNIRLDVNLIGIISTFGHERMMGVNETYVHLLEQGLSQKSGVMSTVKQQFLRRILIAKMNILDENDTFGATEYQIERNLALISMKLSSKFSAKLNDSDRYRYNVDLVECLKTIGEIEPEHYEKCVKIVRGILSKKQFDGLKKFI